MSTILVYCTFQLENKRRLNSLSPDTLPLHPQQSVPLNGLQYIVFLDCIEKLWIIIRFDLAKHFYYRMTFVEEFQEVILAVTVSNYIQFKIIYSKSFWTLKQDIYWQYQHFNKIYYFNHYLKQMNFTFR